MNCYVCGKLIEPKLLLESKNGGSNLYRCPSCCVTFAFPQPDERTINEYYNGMYSHLTNSFDIQKMRWAQKSMTRYLKEIRLNKSPTNNITFLDFLRIIYLSTVKIIIKAIYTP